MKRVFALILCLAFCVVMVASCAPIEEHVHTYETTWSKDADGHWYAPNCGCEDAPRIMEFSHADKNNDGACDVCEYTEHTHTYAEEWTIDCTNHWNAADCGHTVAGANVAAHVDEIYDGKCDVCGYVINDIHNHYYDSKWSSDETNHWHAALCEHGVEVADKAAHELNDAGDCTVCGAKIKDVDMTDLLAVLKAAVANNYKVAFGDVIASEAVYGGTGAQTLENGKTNKVHFALGNGESYIQYISFNMNGAFIGQNEQWYEDLGNGEVFGAEMEYGEHELAPIAGAAQFLNGYNYIPGSIIPSDSADTSTLANMLYALYNQMNEGIRVKDAEQDIENGVYSFSYTYYSVNPQISGGQLYNVELHYYVVDVEFTVNDDLIIDTADFQVEVYRDYENDRDLDYTYTDNGDGTVTIEAYPTLKSTANPSFYTYSVSQMSGERTFTTPYPRASLLPSSFELLYVTETIEDANGNKYPSVTEPIGERIELTSGAYVMFAIGDILPKTASSKFINTDDFTFTFENLDPDSTAEAWYMTPGSTDAMINGYSAYNGCLKLKMRDPGTYTMTVGFGDITKSFTLTILGEPETEISGDADSIDVLLSDFNTYENEDQTYTYIADAEGNYTFTVPAGLGVRIDGKDNPEVDFVINSTGGSFTVGLNAGESVKLYFAAYDATKYTVAVSYVAADIPDPTPGEGGDDEGGEGSGAIASDISGTYYYDSNVLVINNDGTMVLTEGNYTFPYTYTIIEGTTVEYIFNDVSKYTGDGTGMSKVFGYLTFDSDGMPKTFWRNETEHTLSTTAPGGSEGGEGDDDVTLEGSGTEDDPFVIPEAGDYVCAFPGQDNVVWYTYTVKTSGYVTVSTTFGQGGWIELGTNFYNYVSNEGSGEPFEIYYPAGTVLYIGIGDYNAGNVDVPFTVAERAVTSDPITNVVGTWYGTGTTMFATVNYTLTINPDGTGTLVYTNFGSDVSCTLAYVVVEGEKVTIGYTGEYTEGFLACTYSDNIFACTAGVYGESFTFSTTPPTDGGDGDGDEGEDEPTGDTAAVLGYYEGVNGYNIFIFEDGTGGFMAEVSNSGYTIDIYFTVVASANGDGSYTLSLTYLSRPDYEAGVENVDAILAETFVVTPESEEGEGGEEEPAGTFADPFALGENNSCEFPGGYNYKFYKFTAQVAGTLTVTMTSNDFFWAYGAEEFALDTVGSSVASKDITLASGESVWIGVSTDSTNAGTITFTASFEASAGGEEEPEQTQGTFANPFELADNNTCEFPGGYDYVFYSYTATQSGNLTITVTSSDFYWGYGYSEGDIQNVGNVATATLAVEANQAIYIGMSTDSTNAGTVTFTSSFAAGEDEGEVTVNETPMVLGNNSVNGSDINFAYTAESDIVLNVQVGTPVMSGVEVTYSIDGATAVAIANGTSVEVTLTAGQKLVVSAVTSGGYMTITVTEVAQETGPDGSANNPYVIETLPTEITFTGAHDKYYTYTATEAVTLLITKTGGYVSFEGCVSENVTNGYTVALTAGQTVTINPWATSTAAVDYVYNISVYVEPETPGEDEGGEGEGGESTGINGTYLGAGTNSRGMKVVIDTAADTLVITRAASGTLDDFNGQTPVTLTYSEILAKANADGLVAGSITGTNIMNLTFDENGAVKSLTWTGVIYSNFVKQ